MSEPVVTTASAAGAATSAAEATNQRFGMVANVCALGSLAMCYAEVALVAVLGSFGLSVAQTAAPHVQAVLMWVLALLAVIGLFIDRGRHGQRLPVLLAVAGLVVMVATLYLHYDWRILTFAYICLISAIFLNQTMALRQLNATIRNQAAELAEWNESLARRVRDQVEQIERLDKLKRFLSPQVAQLVTQSQDENLLASHRRYITAMFCDLRGFTAFSEDIEPEEAMELLQNFHEKMGELVFEHNGTIDHRAGDGLMVIFNDPLPCDSPVLETLKLAVAMRDAVRDISRLWHKRGYRLGFGIGVAAGYATLGVVGTEGRFDYTANGNVVNLAARLCDEAADDQIIVSQRAYAEVEGQVKAEPLPEIRLQGVEKPVRAFNVLQLNQDD